MRRVDPEKHEKKRQGILEAAERCFVRDGFRGASISGICAEAGISPGHLYHYFASKEAIIGAMTESGLEYATSVFDHMKESPNAVDGLVAEIARAKPGRDRGSSRILVLDMLAEGGRNPAVGAILREHTGALRHLLSDFLRQGQARGQVDRSLDADVAAAILISISDGAKALAIRDPDLDMTKATETLQALVTRFLTPPPEGDRRGGD
jgi:TetR/AcrR family transcriptional repressor of uid operon